MPIKIDNLENFYYRLVDMVKDGEVNTAKRLLRNIEDINQTDSRGESLLMFASQFSNIDMINILIEAGADVHLKNYAKQTAIKMTSNPEIKRILFKQAAKNIITDKYFSQNDLLTQHEILEQRGTCFGAVVEATRHAMKHIEKGENEDKIDVIEKFNKKVQNPEKFQSFAKRVAIYQTLQDEYDKKPIEYQKGDLLGSLNDEQKNIKYLGVSFNIFDENGNRMGRHIISVRKIANTETYEVIDPNVGSRKCDSKKTLNTHIESILQYYQCVCEDHEREIKVVDLGKIVTKYNVLPDSNLSPEDNKKKKYVENTALFTASKKSNVNLIKTLIDEGHNIDSFDQSGTTPLMHAVSENSLQSAECLINSGANLNATDQSHSTALMIAASEGNTEIVDLLLKSGADITIQDKYGSTALMIAQECGHNEIVDILSRKEISTVMHQMVGKIEEANSLPNPPSDTKRKANPSKIAEHRKERSKSI